MFATKIIQAVYRLNIWISVPKLFYHSNNPRISLTRKRRQKSSRTSSHSKADIFYPGLLSNQIITSSLSRTTSIRRIYPLRRRRPFMRNQPTINTTPLPIPLNNDPRSITTRSFGRYWCIWSIRSFERFGSSRWSNLEFTNEVSQMWWCVFYFQGTSEFKLMLSRNSPP